MVEMTLSIIVVSLPGLKPLVQREKHYADSNRLYEERSTTMQK